MDTLGAFGLSQTNRGKEFKVFDWTKAAQLIKQHKPEIALAGLAQDWRDSVADTIYEGGKPVLDPSTFLSSNWATPVLDLDGVVYECYKMQSEVPSWDAYTKWPPEALQILEQLD